MHDDICNAVGQRRFPPEEESHTQPPTTPPVFPAASNIPKLMVVPCEIKNAGG